MYLVHRKLGAAVTFIQRPGSTLVLLAQFYGHWLVADDMRKSGGRSEIDSQRHPG